MIDLNGILERYRPTEKQNAELIGAADEVISGAEKKIKELGLDASAILVGSVAKGTNLASGDLDIFIVFSKEYSNREMEKFGLQIGHELIPDGREKYAEHPYVSGYLHGRKIDIVPCFRISPNTKIISSVDRTPLHTEYVLNNLDERGRDQVRLLKLFMKATGVYGSEVRTAGFSGYVCELLVIHYGSMMEVLMAFSRSKGQFSIGFDAADTSGFTAPVVITDPTDLKRNAAAAISLENLSRMKICSKLFLQDPHERFFAVDRTYEPTEYRGRGLASRVFSLERPDIIDDILYSQANRFRNIIVQILDEDGFMPISSEVELSDRIEVFVECKTGKLPGTRVHTGPPVDAANALDFVRKWSEKKLDTGPYVCGNRLCVDVPVRDRDLDLTVRERLNGFIIGKNIDNLKKDMEISDPSQDGRKYLVIGKFYSRSLP